MAARFGVEHRLQVLLEAARDAIGADTAAVLLLDREAGNLQTVASCGAYRTGRQRFRVPVGVGFAGGIAASGRPRIIEDVVPGMLVNPLLQQTGVRSLLGVPLIARAAEVVGVVHVGTLESRPFQDADVSILQRYAEHMVEAVQIGTSAEEQLAAAALQRSLMPGRLPQIEGLELAARYIPAEGDLGGDWFDVFPLPDQRVGFVMGDVVGHGFRSAVVMGRLRSALRAYALDHDDPAEVVRRLDRKVQYFEVGAMATLIYGISAPPFDVIRLSSAGHLPPVVIRADRSGGLIDVPPDLPVGVDPAVPRRTTAVELPVGGLLLLYTDGLVERRPAPGDPATSLDEGLARLSASISPESADLAITRAINDQLGAGDPEDDVAVLAVRRVPPE